MAGKQVKPPKLSIAEECIQRINRRHRLRRIILVKKPDKFAGHLTKAMEDYEEEAT